MHQIRINLTQEESEAVQRHADSLYIRPAELMRAWIAQSINAGIKAHPTPLVVPKEDRVRVLLTLPEEAIARLGGQKAAVRRSEQIVRDTLGMIRNPATAFYAVALNSFSASHPSPQAA